MGVKTKTTALQIDNTHIKSIEMQKNIVDFWFLLPRATFFYLLMLHSCSLFFSQIFCVPTYHRFFWCSRFVEFKKAKMSLLVSLPFTPILSVIFFIIFSTFMYAIKKTVLEVKSLHYTICFSFQIYVYLWAMPILLQHICDIQHLMC